MNDSKYETLPELIPQKKPAFNWFKLKPNRWCTDLPFTIKNACKIWRITQPRFAIRQKLAASGIICEWTYEKVGPVIRRESELNTCILDEYGWYLANNISYYYYSTWGPVTRPWSINFTIYDSIQVTDFSISLDNNPASPIFECVTNVTRWSWGLISALWILARRLGVRIPLNHVLFILSVRHEYPSWSLWKRINLFRKRGLPAAVNQRRARKWRRTVFDSRSKWRHRFLWTINHSFRLLGGDGQ